MKEMSKKTKIIALMVALIILVGIIVTFTMGLNFDLRYQEAKKIQLYLGKSFEITDIQEIAKEALGNEHIMIQKVEVFEDTVSILSKEITEEQKNTIINKVNEKYGLELSAESIEITRVPHTRGRDIVKPYLTPFIVATIIILVYVAVRYYKLGVMKTLGKTVAALVIAQATLLGVMAITRIPVGRVTIPLVLAVYLLSLVGITTYFEKELSKKKKEEEEEK